MGPGVHPKQHLKNRDRCLLSSQFSSRPSPVGTDFARTHPTGEVKLLLGIYHWFALRLTGTHCLAEGCGRLLLLHTPWQSYRCNRTPARQTLLQRVKRGELQAVHVRTGRRKGLRIEPPAPQHSLFENRQSAKEQCDDPSKAAARSTSRTHRRFGLAHKPCSARRGARSPMRFARRPSHLLQRRLGQRCVVRHVPEPVEGRAGRGAIGV
jgi:hypothetical protein